MAADEKDDPKRLNRRNFLKGAAAGAVVAGVAVGGVGEYQIINLAPPAAPPALTATFSASPAAIKAGGSVAFSAAPGGGTAPYTLSISCGDGSTLSAAGSHTYSAAGNYTALLTVTDSKGVKAYSTVSIAVSALPIPPTLTYSQDITLNVNGTDYQLLVDNRQSLRDAIRDQLGMTGTKNGCDGKGECGACTVLANGKPVLSCMTLAVRAQGMRILTIEGLANPTTGALDPVQNAFLQNDGIQCGYCTPGFILLTKALLAEIPHPTQQQVMEALGGQLCRCGAYPKIIKSALAAGGSS